MTCMHAGGFVTDYLERKGDSHFCLVPAGHWCEGLEVITLKEFHLCQDFVQPHDIRNSDHKLSTSFWPTKIVATCLPPQLSCATLLPVIPSSGVQPLIPEPGTSPWTNHLYESFHAGCVPVILSHLVSINTLRTYEVLSKILGMQA